MSLLLQHCHRHFDLAVCDIDEMSKALFTEEASEIPQLYTMLREQILKMHTEDSRSRFPEEAGEFGFNLVVVDLPTGLVPAQLG